MCPPNCQLESEVSSSGRAQTTGLHGMLFCSACERVCGSNLTTRTIERHSNACTSSHVTQYDIRPPQPPHSDDSQQCDVTIKQLPISGDTNLQHRSGAKFSDKNLRTILRPVGWGGQLHYVLDFRDHVLPGGTSSHPNDSKEIAKGRREQKPQSCLIERFLCTSQFGHQSRQPERVSESAWPSNVCTDFHRNSVPNTQRSLSIWDTCRVYFAILLLCLSLCLPLSSGLANSVNVCTNNMYQIEQCPNGERLVIVNATYGSDGKQCNARPDEITTCSPRWTSHVLTTLCTGRYSCSIRPYLELQGLNCQVRNGQLQLSYTCLSGDHFISLDGRTTAVFSDDNVKSGYLLFAANGYAVNSSLIYELRLNLSHSFHIDLSPLSWYPAFADCDNFKMTTFSPHGKTTVCGDKSRLTMQFMNSSVETIVFHFSANSLKECLLPFLVSSCDLSQITLSSYDNLVINVVQETLEVSCREGYRRTTTDVTVCSHGIWAGSVSVCEEIVCEALGTIPHGQVSLTAARKWKDVATYSCLMGHTLNGTEKRRCQSDGIWSGSVPSCDPTFCNPPVVKALSSFFPNDAFDYDVGASVTFRCQVGWTLIGQDVLTCVAHKSWSHETPSCEIINCGEPGSLNNSMQNYSSTTYGSEVTYTCQSSDEFQAEDKVLCSGTGQWSSTTLTCPQMLPVKSQSLCSDDIITIKCPDGEMVVVVNASYGSSDNNSCNATSGEAMTCSSRWTTQVLTTRCTGKSSCSIRPSTDLQGPECKVTGAQLDFNFTCVSSDHFVTTENGTSVLSDSISWGCLLPSAKEPSDADTEPQPRAQVDLAGVNRFVYLDFAAVNSLPLVENCESLDLTLKSPSGDKTYCKEDIKNLNVIFVDSEVMTLDIQWSIPSANDTRIVVPFLVTECEPKMDEGGPNILLSVDIGKQRLETICPEGYYKPKRSVCVGGVWLGNDSSCLPVSCPILETIPNGQVQLTGSTYKHVATYNCLRKFQLIGNQERVCQHTGVWSGKIPFCQRILCPPPPPLWNGWFFPNNSRYFELDTELNFQCQTGTIMMGQPEMTCLLNNTWSASPPICQLVDCGTPPKPTFTTVTFSTTFYDSEANYVCNENPDVTYNLRCAQDGRWTSPNTTCPTPTTAAPTTSTTSTAIPVVDEVHDEDGNGLALSLGAILGIAFGAFGFILILCIIACFLCSLRTKRWSRTQMVTNMSDIVADNHVTDIRDAPIANVYIIRNSYHEREAPGTSIEMRRPLSENTNHQQETNTVVGHPTKPPRVGNGNSKYTSEVVTKNTTQCGPPLNQNIRANGRNVISSTHNHSHNNNRPLNGKSRMLPQNPNNAQLHNYHITHL